MLMILGYVRSFLNVTISTLKIYGEIYQNRDPQIDNIIESFHKNYGNEVIQNLSEHSIDYIHIVV